MNLLKNLILAIFAFTLPIHSLIYCVIGLITLDTITGVYKAYRIKEAITSKRFGQVVSKLLLYNLAILAGFLVETMIGIQAVHIAQIIGVAVALTELKSVLENITAITGIDLWDVVMNYVKRNQNEITQDVAPSLKSSNISDTKQ